MQRIKMDGLQHSRWRISRTFTILSGRANSNGSAAVDSIEQIVRLISPPARAGETEIELKLISVLKNDGAAAFPHLIHRIAKDLYDEELRRGAAAVDIGIFGSRLFESEVAQSLRAGNGMLWEIV
jgi:hypothetical protein